MRPGSGSSCWPKLQTIKTSVLTSACERQSRFANESQWRLVGCRLTYQHLIVRWMENTSASREVGLIPLLRQRVVVISCPYPYTAGHKQHQAAKQRQRTWTHVDLLIMWPKLFVLADTKTGEEAGREALFFSTTIQSSCFVFYPFVKRTFLTILWSPSFTEQHFGPVLTFYKEPEPTRSWFL